MNEFVAGAAFGVTEDLPELTVGERHGAVRRHETDKGRQHVQQGKEPLALLVDNGFRFLARRDIKGYTADVVNFPFGIAEYLPATLDPANRRHLFSGYGVPARRTCQSSGPQ